MTQTVLSPVGYTQLKPKPDDAGELNERTINKSTCQERLDNNKGVESLRLIEELRSALHEKDMKIRQVEDLVREKDLKLSAQEHTMNSALSEKKIIEQEKEVLFLEVKNLRDVKISLENQVRTMEAEIKELNNALNKHNEIDISEYQYQNGILKDQLHEAMEKSSTIARDFEECKTEFNTLLEEYNKAVDYIKAMQSSSRNEKSHGQEKHETNQDSKIDSNELKQDLERTQLELSSAKEEISKLIKEKKESQSQMTSNLASLEKMKQQLLREKAELSRKLSMDSGTTEKKYRALLVELEEIQQKYNEQINVIEHLSSEKMRLSKLLQQEIERNGQFLISFVKPEPNSSLTNIDPEEEILPSDSLQEDNVEGISEDLTSDTRNIHQHPETDISNIESTPKDHIDKRSSPVNTQPISVNSPISTNPSVSTNPQPTTGWVSSLPLVGRFMGHTPTKE